MRAWKRSRSFGYMMLLRDIERSYDLGRREAEGLLDCFHESSGFLEFSNCLEKRGLTGLLRDEPDVVFLDLKVREHQYSRRYGPIW